MNELIQQIVDGLRNAEIRFTAEDIADACWLAQHLPAARGARSYPSEIAADRTDGQQEQDLKAAVISSGDGEEGSALSAVSTYGSHTTGGRTGVVLHVEANALPQALAVSRAFRPFFRRVRSDTSWDVDDVATAERIADERIWVPVLRHAQERWMDVALVVDVDGSMDIWRRSILRLRGLLETMGAFRSVQTWRITEEGESLRLYRNLGNSASEAQCRPLELVDHTRRRLVFVLSDCVSTAWHNGAVAKLLSNWTGTHPVVLFQLLPRYLWSRTGLRAAHNSMVSASRAVAPNGEFAVSQAVPLLRGNDNEGVSLPVVSLTFESIATWASWATKAYSRRLTAVTLPFDSAFRDSLAQSKESPTGTDILRSFWASASPPTRRLATVMAAAPPFDLALLRSIRTRILGTQCSYAHEAELFLSGLLRVVSHLREPKRRVYDFHDHVRALLLDALPAPDTYQVLSLSAVSHFVAPYLGPRFDLNSVLHKPERLRDTVVPFNDVSAVVLSVISRLSRSHSNEVQHVMRAPPVELGPELQLSPMSTKDPIVAQLPKFPHERETMHTKVHSPFHSRGHVSADLPAWKAVYPFEQEIATVMRAVHRTPCEYVNVIGPLQSGKTTFLHLIRSHLRNDAGMSAASLIDFQYLGDSPTEATLANALWEPVRSSVLKEMHPLDESTATFLRDTRHVETYNELKARLKALGERLSGRAVLVVLIDELESLGTESRTSVLRFLRSLHATRMDDRTERISFVVASSEPPQMTSLGATSPYNIGLEVRLNDLSYARTKEFIKRAEGHMDDVVFSDESVEYLHYQTDGCLALVQELCAKVCDRIDRPNIVTRDDILRATAELLEQPSKVLSTLLDLSCLDAEATGYLRRLICSEPVLPLAIMPGIRVLLARGIAKIDRNNRCTLRSPLVTAVFAKAFAMFPDLPNLNSTELRLVRLPQVQTLLANTELFSDAERLVASRIRGHDSQTAVEIRDEMIREVHGFLVNRQPPFDHVGAQFLYQRYFPEDDVVPPSEEEVFAVIAKVFVHWAIAGR